ncbi:MAG: PqqD family protein [Candidatus Sulfobium sp.]|jgi:Coenzyme PQQ synthesis protein D (PqqD)
MISKSSRPMIREDLQQSDLKDGCVLYDQIREKAYTLNITASLIWSYLDGAISLEEIARELASVSGCDTDTVLRDIVETVTFFRENGLLEQGAV